jgi:hypothetical protein
MALLSRLKNIASTLTTWRWTMHPSQLRITHLFQNTTPQSLSLLLSNATSSNANNKGLAIALASDLPDIIPTQVSIYLFIYLSINSSIISIAVYVYEMGLLI